MVCPSSNQDGRARAGRSKIMTMDTEQREVASQPVINFDKRISFLTQLATELSAS